MSKFTVWEYFVWAPLADVSFQMVATKLDELGVNGWELVTAVRHVTCVEYLFKREKR